MIEFVCDTHTHTHTHKHPREFWNVLLGLGLLLGVRMRLLLVDGIAFLFVDNLLLAIRSVN